MELVQLVDERTGKPFTTRTYFAGLTGVVAGDELILDGSTYVVTKRVYECDEDADASTRVAYVSAIVIRPVEQKP